MSSSKTTKICIAVALWLSTAGYMLLIFFLSSMSLHLPSQLPQYSDKIVHVFIYMPLAFLFFVSLRKSGFGKHAFLISLLLAGIYGITDELHQYFVPGRYASISDVVADLLGAILGSLGATRVKL